jgi:hypothetical protein
MPTSIHGAALGRLYNLFRSVPRDCPGAEGGSILQVTDRL